LKEVISDNVARYRSKPTSWIFEYRHIPSAV